MKNNFQKGVTLIEVVVCVGIFAVLSVSVYGLFTSIINGITYYREKTTISSLADQYLEIVRNIPYSQVGTLEGNPSGSLPDLPNAINLTVNGIDYQIYYAISYVDDSADGTILAGTDSAPNDYKQIKLYVKNAKTGAKNSFLTSVAPKGLEGMASGGALYINVINAVGQPVPGAVIHITNASVTPNIDVTRLSDASGNWMEVGLKASANSYHIAVAKSNYSSDQTYPVSVSNPNPTKPDSTILQGQVTQVSFAIDQLSNLDFQTLDEKCEILAGIGMQVHGAKLIGTPNIYKFSNIYSSDSSGQILLDNIEWDNYTPQFLGNTYMIYGSSPVQQTNILPGTTQNFTLMLGPVTANSLLVIVKDSATGNPIKGAKADLIYNGNTSTKYTGGSIWSQSDWAENSAQQGVSENEIPSGLRLAKNGSDYISSGWLESSTLDTGTNATTYTTINWQPTSQDPACQLKFQIAANNDNATWNYSGPNGTANTYYDVSGTTINNSDNKRYMRYKVFLSTGDNAKTPVLTSVNLNYVSGCSAPGQAMFPGLEKDSGYGVTVSMPGYQTQILSPLSVDGYNTLQVLLSH